AHRRRRPHAAARAPATSRASRPQRVHRRRGRSFPKSCPSFEVVPMPEGIGVVDLMIGFPHRDRRAVYDYLREGAKDAESKDMTFLAEYMFKDVPDEVDEDKDPVDVTIGEMDRFGVDVGLVGLTRLTLEARDRYPGRFLLSLEVNPNDVMESVRAIRRAKEEQDLAAVTFFPAGCLPQVAVVDHANTRGADKIMYAGYFPMGLSLERIFRELPDVPFRDHVWPKFLRENAMQVFKIEDRVKEEAR